MTCPYLDYRQSAGDHEFETARGYCQVADRFVQPMRADICNDRYDLDHETHCEIFRAHDATGDDSSTDAAVAVERDDGGDADEEADGDDDVESR